MNKVYLDENGKVFINGHEVKDVTSILLKTTFTGSTIAIEFTGDYKSDFICDKKVHPLEECTKE